MKEDTNDIHHDILLHDVRNDDSVHSRDKGGLMDYKNYKQITLAQAVKFILDDVYFRDQVMYAKKLYEEAPLEKQQKLKEQYNLLIEFLKENK